MHIIESCALNKKLEFNNYLICRMEAAKNDKLSDKDLQLELTRRKAYISKLKKIIQEKAYTTNVIILKTKN